MLPRLSLLGWALLLVTMTCAAGVAAPERPSATVVVLQPGDSIEVTIVWHDRAIVRGGCCILSPKAELTEAEADEAQRTYRKGAAEARANGVAASFDRKRSEEILKLTGSSKDTPGNKTYLSVIRVSADKDAKSGVTKLYAHWVGGTNVTDRLVGEIWIVTDPDKGDPLLEAIRQRFGNADRVTGSGRGFLHYDLPNGDTLTFVVSGAKVLGAEHKTNQPKGDLVAAIRSRLGKPDRETGSGRAFLDYDLSNGDTLRLVVSDGRVLGTAHKTR
jgi:hypothetical protein